MIKEETIKRLDNLKIGEEYMNGSTTTEIQKKYGISWNTLHQYFIVKNIQTRPKKRREILRPKAPIGAKFGLWTVVSDEVKVGREVIEGSNTRNLYWLCQCICGELAWKNPYHLKNGTSTRCKKCGNKSYLTDEGLSDINAIVAYKYNQTLQNIPTRKHRGRKPKLTFNITKDYLNSLYESQNHKCALSGISLEPNLSLTLQQQNMSIDRVDSNIGYEVGNIQLVDKRINMMKGSLSNKDFIDLCCKVAEHHGYSKCE